MEPYPDEVDLWIARLAKNMTITRPNMREDLAQEGRVAAWTAWNNLSLMPYDVGYAKGAARRRMAQVVMDRRRQLGSELGREKIVATEPVAPEDFPEIKGQCDFTEGAMLAYHRGEIHLAIQRLSPGQQHVTARIMAGQQPGREGKHAWSAAKPKLAAELAHLKEIG